MLAKAVHAGSRGLLPRCSAPVGRTPAPALPGVGALLAAAALLCFAPDALALWGDRAEVFASESITYDDNVFRVSDAEEDDSYTTTSVGVRLDIPLSRQRFLGGIGWDRTSYDRFDFLDFTGRRGQAVWQWRAGSDLSGEIGYMETSALSSLANVPSGGVNVRTANPLKTQTTHVDAAYLLTPRWRLRAAVGAFKQSNEVPEFQINDISVDRLGLTGSYVSPAGNELGINARTEDASYPVRQPVGPALVDNAYRQQHVEIVTDWTLTGRSHLDARAGRVYRRFSELQQRDFQGTTLYAAYEWTPTGKFSLTAVLQRDISEVEEVNIGFVWLQGIALRPTFRVSEKIELWGSLGYSDREYLGDPQTANRTDQVHTGEFTVSFRPVRSLRLNASARREARSSTQASGDYTVDVFSLTARIGF